MCVECKSSSCAFGELCRREQQGEQYLREQFQRLYGVELSDASATAVAEVVEQAAEVVELLNRNINPVLFGDTAGRAALDRLANAINDLNEL